MTFQSSLTPLQTARMITDIANGLDKQAAAKKYGISLRTVYRKLKAADYYAPPGINTKYLIRQLKPCGTNAAYMRHKRKGEIPCTACLAAHSGDVMKNKRKRDKARTSDLARRQRGEVRDLSA